MQKVSETAEDAAAKRFQALGVSLVAEREKGAIREAAGLLSCLVLLHGAKLPSAEPASIFFLDGSK